MRPFVPVALVAGFIPWLAAAQTTLAGRVVGRGNDPIVGAQVTLVGAAEQRRTDREGRFSFGERLAVIG